MMSNIIKESFQARLLKALLPVPSDRVTYRNTGQWPPAALWKPDTLALLELRGEFKNNFGRLRLLNEWLRKAKSFS